MSEPNQPIVPRATYRLQFRKEFGFDAAAELAPYLASLGVSHVYASPYLKARPGSTHGYDIVDHNELNPELGPPEAFERMVAAFRGNGLGQILDFVPNHMGIGGADNFRWLDVLEWGPNSEFADWFDVEWHPDRGYLQDKVLVPFLGSQYGIELQAGSLLLKFDAKAGEFAVWAYDVHKLPICPPSYATILGSREPELERLSDAFAHLPAAQRHLARRAGELKAELTTLVANNHEAAYAIDQAVARFNGKPGDLESWSRLDALIMKQHWRPAHFRVAADDINYRRFFNVNELAGIRTEIPEVFERIHRLVFSLMEDGVINGIRLDHIDGLFDPKSYCLKLRAEAPRPFYLLVEKIIAPHETIRADWNVEGTTGYEFANLLTGLLIDPAGEDGLTRAYSTFVAEARPFASIVRESKLRIMENEMVSELNVLAREAGRLARSHPLTADFTNNVLHRALKQIIACFPVYRTYVDGNPATEADRRDIDWAVAQARRLDTEVDSSVFDFLQRALSGDLAIVGSGYSHVAATRLAMKVQQYSGPVMAKGLEDTALYRYNRFLALNEVGGNPDRFGTSLAQFHAANIQRAKSTPYAMLCTSTHDTKRGEDARARLAVLSELADEWTSNVTAWSRILRAREAGAEVPSPPDRNDEYAFYQLLLAAWPPELLTDLNTGAFETFRQRIEGAMVKSLREAKISSTWTSPNPEYEEAVLGFARHALDASRSNPFLESFRQFVRKVARLGAWNSLVQTLLKLTVPGVPDIYQGSELWNFSLVDPDNRRPVDFAERQAMLESQLCGSGRSPGDLGRLMQNWQDGAIKLFLTRDLLLSRRENPDLFRDGSYEPIAAAGPAADRICAFLRRHADAVMLVAALRYPARGSEGLAETAIPLPEGMEDFRWRSLFGAAPPASYASIPAALFSSIPAAVLLSETMR